MRSFLLGLLFCISAINAAQSQRICGTTVYTNNMLVADPNFKANSQKAEQQIAATVNRNNRLARRDTALNEIIYIPVVVHVLYKSETENISDAQVKSQIDALNKDFRRLNEDAVNTPAAFTPAASDTRIQFCLAQVDPRGKRTNGIDRKLTSRDFFKADDAMKYDASGGAASWDSKQYLNIWVVKLNGSSLAYATPPGTPADKDGVVIAYDVFGTVGNLRPVFNKGRTATHEIGHWLGLVHTWGDQSCGDDHVDDTPAQQSYNFGCPSFPKMSNCSPDANGDMFMNFMDFSDDACMNLFTKGQAQRMRALFSSGNMRNSFLASYACDSTLVQAAPVPGIPTPDKTPTVTPSPETRVFPNPVHSSITVDCKAAGSVSIQTMRIFNSVGVNVYTSLLKQQQTTHAFDKYPAGVYIVQVTDGSNCFTTKIIKL